MDIAKLKFAFLLKTYANDYARAVNLIKSYNKYNIDSLRLFVVADRLTNSRLQEDLAGEDDTITFLPEEELDYQVSEGFSGFSAGYINQEIIKISFWELGLCENYFCLDSDAEFICEFRLADFMHDSQYPYTVMYDDKELMTDPAYYGSYGRAREAGNKAIKDFLNIDPGKKLWTCHGFQTLNSSVLAELRAFSENKGVSYAGLIGIAPYEFTWYNYFLQKSCLIPCFITAPVFKTFHTGSQLVMSCILGKTLEDLSRAYIGIAINSNFSRNKRNAFLTLRDYHFPFAVKYVPFVMRETLLNLLRAIKRRLLDGIRS